MKLGRRSFLKILGGTAAAAVAAPIIAPQTNLVAPVAAPLFVPARNLDMGVPRRILTATEMPPPQAFPQPFIPEAVQREIIDAQMRKTIAMLLLQDNYIPEYGGKLRAGHEVLVDQTTAYRWVRHGVAAPGPNAPRDLQMDSAKRIAERQDRQRSDPRDGTIWGLPVIKSDTLPKDVVLVAGHMRLTEAERDTNPGLVGRLTDGLDRL